MYIALMELFELANERMELDICQFSKKKLLGNWNSSWWGWTSQRIPTLYVRSKYLGKLVISIVTIIIV